MPYYVHSNDFFKFLKLMIHHYSTENIILFFNHNIIKSYHRKLSRRKNEMTKVMIRILFIIISLRIAILLILPMNASRVRRTYLLVLVVVSSSSSSSSLDTTVVSWYPSSSGGYGLILCACLFTFASPLL